MRVRGSDIPRRWDAATLIVIIGTAGIWVTGTVLILSQIARTGGWLCIAVGAMMTVLLVVRSWLFRLERAFSHGYHAGWHDCSTRECYPAEDCDVMNIADVRARRG